MVETSGKIIYYSNISWIANETVIKRKSFLKLLALISKYQHLNSLLDKNQKANSIDESLIFANFYLFELT